MAMVAGIVDADPERRELFLKRAGAYLDSAYPEMLRRRWDQGGLNLLAASADTTPVHESAGPDGWIWVMGDIYADEEADPASLLQRSVAKTGHLAIQGQSGFYLACAVDASGRVTLGTDPMGIFPLYYWSSGGAFVFATLPDLIQLHPAYARRISAEGLACLLLQSYMANGQTLWEGIHRPGAGQAVQWLAGGPARTPTANPLLPSEAHFGLGMEAASELFDATLHTAIKRSTRRSSRGLMLSGGLDSRLVAGHLNQMYPGATRAVIFSADQGNEARCAVGVARALGMPSMHLPVRYERFPELALEAVREEHLANTLHDFAWLSGADGLASHIRTLVTGFGGDAVMGGSQIVKAFNPRIGRHDFETLLADAFKWGFTPGDIASLVRGLPMAGAANWCIQAMGDHYASLPGLPFQKVFLWTLYHRGRHHAGAYPWRLAKSVWPVMPYMDRSMLETALGMPLAYLGERRMQIDILKRRYRHLAVLPRDRNARDTRPLLESGLQRAGRHVRRWFAKLRQEHADPRTYHRVFDINNPGWRGIRQLAQTRAETAHRLFDRQALDRYLPPPEQPVVCGDAITDSARLKTLIGLMLLSDQLTA